MITDVPVRLCCGQRHLGPQCPDGLVMCVLCFERKPIEQLHVEKKSGQREDVCLACAQIEHDLFYRRAAFEAACKPFYQYPFTRMPHDPNEYEEQLIHYVWRGWKMAIDHQKKASQTPSQTVSP
jgi:hypothetical protein